MKGCIKSWHCSHCHSIIKGDPLIKDIGVWDDNVITCMLCYNFMLSLDKTERNEYYYNIGKGFFYTHIQIMMTLQQNGYY